MRMNKKAALELSVNAIVILIIAIVMLGMGLGFVRSLFGGATNKFSALISEEQAPSPPSSSNIITLSRGVVTAAPKSDNVIKISVYNPTNLPFKGGVCKLKTGGTEPTCNDFDSDEPACGPSVNTGVLGCYWKDSTDGCEKNSVCTTGTPDLITCGTTDAEGILGCNYDTTNGCQQGDALPCASPSFFNTRSLCEAQGADCEWDSTSGTGGVAPSISCKPNLASMAFIVNPKQINPGKYETFDALFSIPDGVTQGSTDLCQINIEGATTDAVYYKDFTIKIQ